MCKAKVFSKNLTKHSGVTFFFLNKIANRNHMLEISANWRALGTYAIDFSLMTEPEVH